MAVQGILGGTFDPIHIGHLVLAEAAREELGLEQVVFVPAGNPPHKPGSVVAPARHRLRMVEIALGDNPHYALDTQEIERKGPSYTVDTVSNLRSRLPGVEWYLLTGSDTLSEIPTWHEFQSLMGMVRIGAAARPGAPLILPPALIPWKDRVRFFPLPALDISSSMIRAYISKGRSVRYLVPTGVEDYLDRLGLYDRKPDG